MPQLERLPLAKWITQEGLDALPMPTYVYSTDGMLVAGNTTAEEFWKVPNSALVNNFNLVANAEALGRSLIEEFLASVVDGEPRHAEPMLFDLKGADPLPVDTDTRRWLQVYFIPLKDADGTVHYMIGMGLDATSEMLRQEKIQAAEQKVGEQRETIARLETAQREIERQRETILQLSSPIIDVWRGVVLLPVVGEIDSERAQMISERLLGGITSRRSRFAILDLTGASELDAYSADALMRIRSMVRLLGTECLLAGIQPAVARTIIELGIGLGDVKVFGDLSDALEYCMRQ